MPILTSESSSSEDETERNHFVKVQSFVEITVRDYSHLVFKQHFRMERNTVEMLIEMYANERRERQKGGWPKVTPEKAVLLTVWYLSNSETYRQTSDRFNVSSSCAYYILKSVTSFLVRNSSRFIKWSNLEKAAQDSISFERKKGLRNIIGAIDGCHIKINRPVVHEGDYVNRKGYHSLILQGVVDSRLCFMNISAGHPGSMHDARVLRRSALYIKAFDQPQDLFYNAYRLLGDSAYPRLEWLTPPFKDNGHLTNDQQEFNYNHSATRIIIEHAFGLLKGRFRRLRQFENTNISLVIQCITTACILHNICMISNDNFDEVFLEEI